MSIEFGKRGPEGIKGEGASGWDELRYVPFSSKEHEERMVEEAEEISRKLERMTMDSDEGDGAIVESKNKDQRPTHYRQEGSKNTSDAPKDDSEESDIKRIIKNINIDDLF